MNVLNRCFSFSAIYAVFGVIICALAFMVLTIDLDDATYSLIPLTVDKLFAIPEFGKGVAYLSLANILFASLRWWHIKADTFLGRERTHLNKRFIFASPTSGSFFASLVPMLWMGGLSVLLHPETLQSDKALHLGFQIVLLLLITITTIFLVWRLFLPELFTSTKTSVNKEVM